MEIRLDKATLPADGQRVKFTLSEYEYEGIYSDEDEIFSVGFENVSKLWFFAFQVDEWEPLT